MNEAWMLERDERQARAEIYVFPADPGGETGEMADGYGIPMTRAAFLNRENSFFEQGKRPLLHGKSRPGRMLTSQFPGGKMGMGLQKICPLASWPCGVNERGKVFYD